jgi:hypothetical protein
MTSFLIFNRSLSSNHNRDEIDRLDIMDCMDEMDAKPSNSKIPLNTISKTMMNPNRKKKQMDWTLASARVTESLL